MMTAARPITIAPRPMSTLLLPWYWASRPPARPTMPLDIMRPITVLRDVLMPWARAIWRLAPVARSALPLSVLKNHQSSAMTAAVITSRMGRGFERFSSRT